MQEVRSDECIVVVVDDHPSLPPKSQLVLRSIAPYTAILLPLLKQSLQKCFVSRASPTSPSPPATRRCTATQEMVDLDTNHLAYRYPGKRGIDDDFDDSRTERTDTSSTTCSVNWSYDKMASVPKMAEAFRAFAWRALCQESVMFLEEVSK